MPSLDDIIDGIMADQNSVNHFGGEFEVIEKEVKMNIYNHTFVVLGIQNNSHTEYIGLVRPSPDTLYFLQNYQITIELINSWLHQHPDNLITNIRYPFTFNTHGFFDSMYWGNSWLAFSIQREGLENEQNIKLAILRNNTFNTCNLLSTSLFCIGDKRKRECFESEKMMKIVNGDFSAFDYYTFTNQMVNAVNNKCEQMQWDS